MLATTGFIVTAILLAVFAFTFDRIVRKNHKNLRLFSFAYLLMALAFLMWGILSWSHDSGMLPHSVLIGDGLLFIASICTALIIIPLRWRGFVVVVSTVLAVELLYTRVKYYYPAPYLHGGILYFNTQSYVVLILSAILVLAWIPACLKIARIMTANASLERYYSIFVLAYALPVITAVFFVEARRRTVIIETFIAFGVSLILLVLSNIVIMSSNSGKIQNAAK